MRMAEVLTDNFPRNSTPEPQSSILTMQNPQITAALLNSPMQQEHFVPQGQQMGQQPNGVGPIRVQTMPQMRQMPYNLPPQQQPPQMRQMPLPPQNPHYSPMGMNPQNQFAGNGQIQISQHPQMPQQQPSQMQMQHNFPPNMGMQQPVQQMPMGMPVQQHVMIQQNQPQNPQPFLPSNSPMPPPIQPAPVSAAPASSSSSVASQPQQPGPIPVGLSVCGAIMEKARLDELMAQINKNTVLEEGVKDALVEYADDFVTSVIDKACRLIKHRGSRKIEARDIEFVLQNVYNMPTVPRAAVHIFGGPDSVDLGKEKHIPTEAHKQRLALLKKQLKKI